MPTRIRNPYNSQFVIVGADSFRKLLCQGYKWNGLQLLLVPTDQPHLANTFFSQFLHRLEPPNRTWTWDTLCWDGEKVVSNESWNGEPNRMVMEPMLQRWIVYGGELFSQLHTISPWIEERKTFSIPDGLFLKWEGLQLLTNDGPVDTCQAIPISSALEYFQRTMNKECEQFLSRLPLPSTQRTELMNLHHQLEEDWKEVVKKRFEGIVPSNEECPVCLERPGSRQHLCLNRHILCESCSVLWGMRDGSKGCPLCRDENKWLRTV
jgi:hypothetical protein